MFLGTEDADAEHGNALGGLVSWLSGGFGGARDSIDPDVTDEPEDKGPVHVEGKLTRIGYIEPGVCIYACVYVSCMCVCVSSCSNTRAHARARTHTRENHWSRLSRSFCVTHRVWC